MFHALLPASLYTHHMPSGDGTGPSGRIAGAVVGAANNPDGSARLFAGLEEDYHGEIDAGAGTSGSLFDRLTFYKDTAATLDSNNARLGGVVNLTTAATDNHEAWLKSGVVAILNAYTTFFESRQVLPVGAGDVFVGLMDPGPAAENIIADDGTLPDANYFGFKIASGQIDFVARKAGQPTKVLASNLATVAGEHSLGFIFSRRPVTSSLDKLVLLIDNEYVGNIPEAQLLDADTPLNVPLAAVAGFKNTAGTSLTMEIDWQYVYTLMD